MRQVLDVINHAAAILNVPAQYVRCTYNPLTESMIEAEDQYGYPCSPDSKDAAAWSCIGIFYSRPLMHNHDAGPCLEAYRRVDAMSHSHYNSTLSGLKEYNEVVKCFKLTIKRLEFDIIASDIRASTPY